MWRHLVLKLRNDPIIAVNQLFEKRLTISDVECVVTQEEKVNYKTYTTPTIVDLAVVKIKNNTINDDDSADVGMSREDGARFSPQPTKNKSCCSVNGCFSKACRDLTVRFHAFPKPGIDFINVPNEHGLSEQMSRREAWAQRLMMDKAITENTRVCSLHFKRNDYILPDAPTQKRYLKRDAIPSCNLPVAGSKSFQSIDISNESSWDATEKYSRRNSMTESYDNGTNKRHRGNKIVPETVVIKDEPLEDEIDLEPQNEDPDELSNQHTLQSQNFTDSREELDDLSVKEEPPEDGIKFESVDLPDIDLNISLEDREASVSGIRNKNWSKSNTFQTTGTQTDERTNEPKFTDVIQSNKDLNVLTGIPNFSVLNTIIDVVRIVSPRFTKAKSLKLNIEDRIIMTLMKLKQDLTYGALSAFFKCKSKQSCKKIIVQTLKILSCALKFAIRWPRSDEVIGNADNISDELHNVRCVVNRIEIAMRKPKDPLLNMTTFSHNKRHNSAKFLTAITPTGFICLLSKAYGGRTCHKTLFKESNIVNLLKKNDTIMVLKDFPIDDICREHNIKLIKSLYSRITMGVQDPDNYRVQLNVNRRIHRFRIFRRKLTKTLSLRTEEILTILCAIENLNALTFAISSSKQS